MQVGRFAISAAMDFVHSRVFIGVVSIDVLTEVLKSARFKVDPILLLETLLVSLSDYTVDKRGDIGSFVRESAMKGIQVRYQHVLNIVPFFKQHLPFYLF